MPETDDNVVAFAALVLLRREAAKPGGVRLTPADFEVYRLSSRDAVKLGYDEDTGDVTIVHKTGGQA